MSLMMPVFKRGQMGTVTHRYIGAEQWPEFQSQGWYDADDKVPLAPGQMPPEQPDGTYHAPVKPYGAFGSVLGEIPTVTAREAKPAKAAEPALARDKGNGRFVKAGKR